MGDGDIRVSDAERQQVVDRLSRAVGDGLITLDEFADHAGAAYAAITRDELDAVSRELRLPVLAPMPTPAPMPASAPVEAPPKRRWVVGIMSGEKRTGKWRASRRIGAFAFWGNAYLDLRDAVLEGDVIEITAWAIMGGVDVIVPEGIPVECTGLMIMGGRSNRIKDVPMLAGAPEIRVKGYGMWGGINVRSRPPRGEQTEYDDPVREALAFSHEVVKSVLPAPFVPPPPPPLPHLPPPPRSGGSRGGRDRRNHPQDERVAPTSGLVTIVNTDIVGSTRYADTLGDQRWRALLGTHNDLVRNQLQRHGGQEVKTSGDGFLLTFASPRAAVHFGVDVQTALAEYRLAHPDTPLEVRIGVHAGEVERDGNDVIGRNVTLACRLCDVAAPGEVLVSSVVADLADSASDLAFGEGRQLQLAGIERVVSAHPASRR